jgi:quercetin dioxygenase-like cupin family protein
LGVAAILGAAAAVATAQQPQQQQAQQPAMHKMVAPNELVWGDAPPSLPPGAKLAVLYGDPGKQGLFILRLKLPANFKIPAHWHPTDENVNVISGAFMMGMGDKLDPAKAKELQPGGFASMPAKTNHFAIAKKETIVQVTAMGPFVITYVNPEDDPRKTAAAIPPAPKR